MAEWGHKKIGKMTIGKIFFTHSPDTMTSKNAVISSSCWWMCVKSLIINDMNRCDPILIEIPGKIHSFFLAMVWWAYREVKAQRMCCSFRANSMYRITSPSRCLCMQISANKTLFFFLLQTNSAQIRRSGKNVCPCDWVGRAYSTTCLSGERMLLWGSGVIACTRSKLWLNQ